MFSVTNKQAEYNYLSFIEGQIIVFHLLVCDNEYEYYESLLCNMFLVNESGKMRYILYRLEVLCLLIMICDIA